MNPFPEFHIPPTEAALLQRFANAAEKMKGPEAIELFEEAAKLRATIADASLHLEQVEKRYSVLKGERDEALRQLRGYYEVDGAAPGETEPDPHTLANQPQDGSEPSETVIGSASEVSDEQVAEAQRQDAREAEQDSVEQNALETVAG